MKHGLTKRLALSIIASYIPKAKQPASYSYNYVAICVLTKVFSREMAVAC